MQSRPYSQKQYTAIVYALHPQQSGYMILGTSRSSSGNIHSQTGEKAQHKSINSSIEPKVFEYIYICTEMK